MNLFVVVITLLYFSAGVYDWCAGNKPMAGLWTCYALANVCLLANGRVG